MASLIDTNVLIYRFDPRFPRKQARAEELLQTGIAKGSIRLAHQTVIEFVAAVSRPIGTGSPILAAADARREAEELLSQFEVLYPNAAVVRTALRGMAAYELSWFDAHMWAYAEVFGLAELITEDLQANRLYGSVRVVNPFA